MMNMLNGGAHADNNVDLQEFMLMPVGAGVLLRGAALGRRGVPRAEDAAARRAGSHRASATRAASRRTSPTDEDALQLLRRGDRAGGLHAGRRDRHRARPRASTSSTATARYDLAGEGEQLDATSMVAFWTRPGSTSTRSSSIEDGLAEDDWDGWAPLTGRSATASSSSATTCSSPTPSGSERGIDEGVANAILIKVNQIGTLTETLDAIGARAARNGYAS